MSAETATFVECPGCGEEVTDWNEDGVCPACAQRELGEPEWSPELEAERREMRERLRDVDDDGEALEA